MAADQQANLATHQIQQVFDQMIGHSTVIAGLSFIGGRTHHTVLQAQGRKGAFLKHSWHGLFPCSCLRAKMI